MDPNILREKINHYNTEKNKKTEHNDFDLDGKIEDEILNTLYKMCRDLTLFNVPDRIQAFSLLYTFNEMEFSSEISRLQMRFPHLISLRHPSLENDVSLMTEIGKSSEIPTMSKMECMTTLFKEQYFTEAYNICHSISINLQSEINYAKDCIFLLFSTGEPQYIEQASQACLKIIQNATFEKSKEIIEILLPIGQENDLYVNILFEKVPWEYDEDIAVPLFERYFTNDIFNVHYKLFSAQFLIQTSEYEKGSEKRKELLEKIYLIGLSENNEKIVQGMKGDCGDFLINWSEEEEYITKGRDIINKIKFENVPLGLQNVYSNKENVHEDNFIRAINDFILNRVMPNADKLPVYDNTNTLKDISEHIYKIKHSSAKYKALDSFDRIKSDMTKFTFHKVLSVDVLCYLWNYIRSEKHSKAQRKEWLQRFMQEMVEMYDTCTSGHVSRIINVISKEEKTLTITFTQQIIANVQGRIKSRLKDVDDADAQENYIMALMDTAEPELKQQLHDWVLSFKTELYEELKIEFVGEGHVEKEEFDSAFDQGLKGWVLNH